MSKKPNPKKAPEGDKPAVKKAKASRTPAKKSPAKKPAAKKPPVKAPAKKPTPRKRVEPKLDTPAPQTPPDQDADTEEDGDLCGLSPRSAKFIDLYLATYDAGTSYVEAGFTAKSRYVAQVAASRLLNSVKGRAYLAKRMKPLLEDAEVQQKNVLKSITSTAFADPNELVSIRVGACRFCWGKAFRYQYTAGEWEKALLDHERLRERELAKDRPDPGPMDEKGGTGYLRSRDPNPDCPECCGEGKSRMVMKPTESLSPAALALYAGVKETKDGIGLVLNSQDKARDVLAKIHKLYDDSTKVDLNVDMSTIAEKGAALMRHAHEQAAKLRRERFGDAQPPTGTVPQGG